MGSPSFIHLIILPIFVEVSTKRDHPKKINESFAYGADNPVVKINIKKCIVTNCGIIK